MKRSILILIATMFMCTACGHNNHQNQITEDQVETQTPTNMIVIGTQSGPVAIDPETNDTVIIRSANATNPTNDVAVILHPELNKCGEDDIDENGDGIICGPKNVFYGAQLDFGKLGVKDNNISTPDGGVLLYDAFVVNGDGEYTGLPLEGNRSENRIQAVYIPSNYVHTTDAFKAKSIDEQYQLLHDNLVNKFSVQFMISENNDSLCNNPYFTDDNNTGRFIATCAVLFTEGQSMQSLQEKFDMGNYLDLEYLTVEFEVDVKKGNSGNLIFSIPVDSNVTFGGKLQNTGGVSVTTTNNTLKLRTYVNHSYVHPNFSINLAEYIDGAIKHVDTLGIGNFAKDILVRNIQQPAPVKIFTTLHEIKENGEYARSFVRNPGKLDASLFGLTWGPYGNAYSKDNNLSNALETIIVYPIGKYN